MDKVVVSVYLKWNPALLVESKKETKKEYKTGHKTLYFILSKRQRKGACKKLFIRNISEH